MLASSEAPKKQTFKDKARLVKRHFTWHYYSRMPQRKLHRILVWVAFLSYAGIFSVQMLYPLDRALPLASLFGEAAGYKKHEELAALVQKKFQGTTATISTKGKKLTFDLKKAGAEPATETMIRQTEEYPFWQRFLPFSIFWQPVQIVESKIYYSPIILESFSKEASKQLTSLPVNAGLSLENGELRATSDVPGIDVTATDIKKAITGQKVILGQKNTITPRAKVKQAETTVADFQEVKQQATAALAQKITIIADGIRFQPSAEQVATWLVIGVDANKQPTLSFNQDSFNSYLNTIDTQRGVPAGTTRVTLTDGNETARVVGSNGRAVTREPLLENFKTLLISGRGNPTVTASFHDVAPSVAYNSIYTSSQAGLQAYLNDVARRMNVRIAIQQVGGAGWSAEVRGGEGLPSASTYKLFVAKWLFTQMEAGTIHWEDPILDTNVSTCFDRMTIASTNPCAEEWLRQIGRSNMNTFVYGLGFSSGTSFTNPTATHTTPNDLRKYMLGLQSGSLVGGAYRDRLLHSLISHPYRTGIPSGSRGTVYDKVGFLWDYVHDAAIVYHPRGTYVMVVMTKGQSYSTIAAITRQVEGIMYP